MTRRDFLPVIAAPALGIAQSPRPLNIVLIVADDQGYGDLSSHGNTALKTPHLDGLAAGSTEYTRFHACPVCAPTRASLMTGRYHLRSNVHGVTQGRETMALGETTIADTLREAGYRTALYGKWHLGMHYPYVPHGRGFEEFIGFRTGHLIDYFDPLLEHNGKPSPQKGYITEIITDHTLRFMEANRSRPFFVYAAYNVPHSPFMAPDRYWDTYSHLGLPADTAAAYALTACLDDNIGRLLAGIDKLGLRENTAVVYLSDNGPNGHRFNGGLHGIKGSVYEGGTREPMFLRCPGRSKAGAKVDRIASVIDLAPTLLEICGVERRAGKPFDGVSLVPLLGGTAEKWPDRQLFVHGEPFARPNGMFPGAVRTQRFNLVNGNELYDVVSDPGETINVAGKFPDVAKQLRAAYEKWFVDVLPTGGFKRLRIPIGYDEENPAYLPAPEATLSAGLSYAAKRGYAWDWVTDWKSASDSVSWEADAHQSGTYEVSAEYLCPAASLGSEIEVRIGSGAVKAKVAEATSMKPLPNRDLLPRLSEVPRMEWKTLRLGEIPIASGPSTVTVRALTIPGEVAMDLYRVGLKRVK